MARLMEKEPLVEKCAGVGGGGGGTGGSGGRKLSFKTKAPPSDRRNYRTSKATVAEMASKFNAVIVETRGKETRRKVWEKSWAVGGDDVSTGGGAVKAAVKAFENQQRQVQNARPKVVVLRKQSFIYKPDPPSHTEEPAPSPMSVTVKNSDGRDSKQTKPKVHPKPECTVLERRISLSFKGPYKLEQRDFTLKEKKLSIPKDHTILESVLNECPTPDVQEAMKPNNSFLWRPKTDTIEEQDKENQQKNIEPEKDNGTDDENMVCDSMKMKDESGTENLQMENNIPLITKKDTLPEIKNKNIKPQANLSSLYKNIIDSNKDVMKPGEIVENYSTIPSVDGSEAHDEIRNSDLPAVPPMSSDYEDIEGWQVVSKEESNNYEDVYFPENNYDVIYEYESDEPLYDDVKPDRYYEHVQHYKVCNDSDSSWDHNNSLYGIRPSSRASTASGAVISGASRSDISDDWVDVETEELSGERQKEIVCVQERTRYRVTTCGWSQKVRRQWSKKAADQEQCDSDKIYEAVGNHDEDSAVYDDFDSSSDSASSGDEGKVRKPAQGSERTPTQSEGIYALMREAGRRVRKSLWLERSLRRIGKISQSGQNSENECQNINLSRGRWPSLKKFNKVKSTSTFYLKDESDLDITDLNVTPEPRTETRSSPPPHPPPGDSEFYSSGSTNVESKRHPPSSSWYSDVGLYDKNNRPSDTASEHSSSEGSDLNMQFADEPLYQFYIETVAKMECTESDSEVDCYEEIGKYALLNNSDVQRPSVLDLPASGIHRTLWSQVPQVISSGILDKLTAAEQKLQEAKFELVTSEASYYKSLTILERHFASNPFMKDKTVVPKLEYKILFSNVAPVRKCSEIVIAALDKCWQSSIMMDGICGIIHQLSLQHFHVYVRYCTNQVLIESSLKKLKQANSSFAETLNALENSKDCQGLSLYSFLLLPMQRITRMPLLLDAIRTKLDPDSAEFESCTLALAQLQKIAHDCDEAARKLERYEEMAMLSQALNFPSGLRPLPLLSASRWLERSGQVTHINMDAKLTFSRKLTVRNSKLTLFLFTDYLIITKKKSEDNYLVVDYCPRSHCQVSKVDDAIPKFPIELIMLQNHEGKTQAMMLYCGSDSSRERWLQAFASPHSSNSDEKLYACWDCPQVAATHAYTASQPDELALQQGDVVNVLRKLSDGWYYGERIRDGEKGWFPGNHTREIVSMHMKARNLKLRYRLLALSADYLQKIQKNNL